MPKSEKEYISDKIIEKAKEFGACLAGIASVEALKNSPSHYIYGKLDEYKGVGTKETDTIKPREVTWPEKAKAAIIIAVEHPEEKPELDWWKDGYRGGTVGNEILMSISDKLSAWLEETQGIKTNKLPYYIEYGGIFLKDAAVMAGLGCIGKNNLLVTPEFGPRVRMRAMLTHEILPGTEPTDFDPCEECHMPCRRVCPQEAFRGKIASAEQFGLSKLPGRTGVYSRHLCNIQMELDVANSEKIIVEGRDESGRLIRYCRSCELACPIGQAV
jgi:epoxyqueuosine reductase